MTDSSTILQYWGHIHYSSGGHWTISLTVGQVNECSSSRTRYWGNIRPIMSTIISPIITLSSERKILIQTKYSFLMKWWSSWFMIIKKFLLCPSVLVIGIIGNSSILTGYIFCISVEFHIEQVCPIQCQLANCTSKQTMTISKGENDKIDVARSICLGSFRTRK